MFKVAIVGITGLVGQKMLETLQRKKFPIKEIVGFASDTSANTTISLNNQTIKVKALSSYQNEVFDFAFFAVSQDLSLEYAPKFVENGAIVIDNSNAFRMNDKYLLVVPEVNGHLLTSIKEPTIIANPNCSTIQLVVVLNPLHKELKINKAVVATYQSVSGAGKLAIEELKKQTKQYLEGQDIINDPNIFAYPIAFYNIPQVDIFMDNLYTKEEMKMINETQKIMGTHINISPTCVRVPTINCHAEAVYIEFEKPIDNLDKIKTALQTVPSIIIQDDTKNKLYPTNIIAKDRFEVFVGRIRKDFFNNNAINLWIVADNLLKGAASNAIEIAEELIKIRGGKL